MSFPLAIHPVLVGYRESNQGGIEPEVIATAQQSGKQPKG